MHPSKRPAFNRFTVAATTPVPTSPQLSHLDDEALERLAVAWRAQALRGDREANGIAHALEVERRRRLRASQLAQLPLEPVTTPRPWWKLWGADKHRDQAWPT